MDIMHIIASIVFAIWVFLTLFIILGFACFFASSVFTSVFSKARKINKANGL